MTQTIDMQDLRYLNLFLNITGVRTRYCFKYNEIIFFCVPSNLISKTVGRDGRNVKQMSELLRKKIKIITYPRGIADIKQFIRSIVEPVRFNDLEINDREIILNAGRQSKAALIGRNKRRFLEMQKIVQDYFEKDFKII
jgi:NusA-like KH domain protein